MEGETETGQGSPSQQDSFQPHAGHSHRDWTGSNAWPHEEQLITGSGYREAFRTEANTSRLGEAELEPAGPSWAGIREIGQDPIREPPRERRLLSQARSSYAALPQPLTDRMSSRDTRAELDHSRIRPEPSR